MASTFEAYILSVLAGLATPVTTTPTATSTDGTPTVGTTETMDAVLGTYQCQLVAGRRYMAIMNGLNGNLSVANDIFRCNIRNSGTATTPVATDTLVAQTQWTSTTTATASRLGIPLAGSFIAPTTGTNTFAFFAQRQSGTGVFTPIPPNPGVMARELFVMYLGLV